MNKRKISLDFKLDYYSNNTIEAIKPPVNRKCKSKKFKFHTKIKTARGIKIFKCNSVEYKLKTVQSKSENTNKKDPKIKNEIISSTRYMTKIFKTQTKLITPKYTIIILNVTLEKDQTNYVTNKTREIIHGNKSATIEVLKTKNRTSKTQSRNKKTKEFC